MKKFFSMAALVLMGAVMTGCSSSDDNSIIDTPQQPSNTNKLVTLTTTVSMETEATTRALTSEGVKTFAVGEKMAVIYHNGTKMVKAESHELAVGDITNEGKSATFTFDLETPNKSQDVTYIYPAEMANDNGVNYSNLANQDGTLENLARAYDLCTKSGAWVGDDLPSLTLDNQLAILAITLKDDAETPKEITSGITSLVLRDGTNNYTINRSAAAGPIYVAIRPTNSAGIMIKATDGKMSYKKSLTNKTYEAGNGYNVSWRMQSTQLPETYKYPDGYDIYDCAVDEWLRKNGFTQNDIDALGNDKAAIEKFNVCFQLNCDFTVEGAGGSVEVTNTAFNGNYATVTVELTRTAPLGFINYYLYLYADDELIPDEVYDTSGDLYFPIAPTTDTVTQTVTITFYNNYPQAKSFKAVITCRQENEPGDEEWEEPGGEE